MQPLTELTESFRVYAVCAPCARMEAMDLEAVIARLGPGINVEQLRARVRCRGCGERTRDIRIVYVGPRERPASFHYRR